MAKPFQARHRPKLTIPEEGEAWLRLQGQWGWRVWKDSRLILVRLVRAELKYRANAPSKSSASLFTWRDDSLLQGIAY